MNDKLVQLHDGELDDQEATRMRASLTEEAADRAMLDAMHRVDRTLIEVDRLIAPGAERIESGKDTLKAVLRDAASDRPIRGGHLAFRRRIIAVAGGALAAAAAIAIWVAWPAAGVIGTVWYDGGATLVPDHDAQPIHLGSSLTALPDGKADIDVPGVFQMRLSRGGEVRIGQSADDLRLVCGWATLHTFAEATLRLGDGPHYVVARPHSTFKVRMPSTCVELAQQRGTSVLVMGDRRQTVEAGTTVRLDLTTGNLTESDGPEQ